MTATRVSKYPGRSTSSEVQVRLTPDRVRRWEFDNASFARRGYDHQDVDRFRYQVADELDHMAAQLANLWAENERLNDQVELYRHGVIPSQPDRPAAREVNLLSSAQREAEQIIAQAHDYARQVAEYARAQYEHYMRAAVEEAREEAQRAVQDYRASAGAGFEDSVAAREALRTFGEMMISQMQAAARQLEDGSVHLTRMVDRFNLDRSNAVDGGNHRSGPAALSPHADGARSEHW